MKFLQRVCLIGLPAGQGFGPLLDRRHNIRLDEAQQAICAEVDIGEQRYTVEIPRYACILFWDSTDPELIRRRSKARPTQAQSADASK